MKAITSKSLRRLVSILLTILMAVSMVTVAMVEASAASIPASTEIYFDNTNTGFSTPYLSVPKDSVNGNSTTTNQGSYYPKNDAWYTMTNVSGNIWKATISTASTYGKMSFWDSNYSGYNDCWGGAVAFQATYPGSASNLYTPTASYTANTSRGNIKVYSSGSWSKFGLSFTDPTAVYKTLLNTTLNLNSNVTNAAGDVTFITTCTSANASYATIGNADNFNPTFSASQAGVYTLVTTVTDGLNTVEKIYTITVSDGSIDDADLIAILKGEKVNFYIAEPTSFNQPTLYVYSSNSVTDIAGSGTIANGTVQGKNGSATVIFTSILAPSARYYVGHSGWVGLQMTEMAQGGSIYITNNSTTISGNSSNNNYAISNKSGITLYVDGIAATEATIAEGDASLALTNSLNSTTSVIGKTNSFLGYYITSDGSSFKEFDPSSTSSLTEGTYTIYPVVTDGRIKVRGDALTLTVEGSSAVTAPTNVSLSIANPADTYYAGQPITLTASADAPEEGIEQTFLTTVSANASITNETSNSPVFSSTIAGTYTVTLTATNSDGTKGKSSTATVDITVVYTANQQAYVDLTNTILPNPSTLNASDYSDGGQALAAYTDSYNASVVVAKASDLPAYDSTDIDYVALSADLIAKYQALNAVKNKEYFSEGDVIFVEGIGNYLYTEGRPVYIVFGSDQRYQKVTKFLGGATTTGTAYGLFMYVVTAEDEAAGQFTTFKTMRGEPDGSSYYNPSDPISFDTWKYNNTIRVTGWNNSSMSISTSFVLPTVEAVINDTAVTSMGVNETATITPSFPLTNGNVRTSTGTYGTIEDALYTYYVNDEIVGTNQFTPTEPGSYKIGVKASYNTLSSSIGTSTIEVLGAIDKPNVTVDNSTIREDGSATFTVDTTGLPQGSTFKYEIYTLDGTLITEKEASTDNMYTVSGLTPDSYYCVVKVACEGYASVTTDKVDLTVTALPALAKPKLTVDNASQVQGKRFTFTAATSGEEYPEGTNFTFTLYDLNNSVVSQQSASEIAEFTTDTLSVIGSYYCIVTVSAPDYKSASSDSCAIEVTEKVLSKVTAKIDLSPASGLINDQFTITTYANKFADAPADVEITYVFTVKVDGYEVQYVDGKNTATALKETVSATYTAADLGSKAVEVTVDAFTGYGTDEQDQIATGSASATINVTKYIVPFAQEKRIYAHAVAGSADTDSWAIAEAVTAPIGSSDTSTMPTVGSTSASAFRVFLPTTASNTQVEILNTYDSSITIGDVVIPKGQTAVISYTAGQAYNLVLGTSTNERTITFYQSKTEGAVFVNDASRTADELIAKIYSDKETGAVSNITGGVASDGTAQTVAVKKIKGRGNTTWMYTNKKGMNLTFSSNVTVAGLTGTKFSMLANHQEPSLARNRIVLDLADQVGVTYSPDSRFVDYYLNGLYMGQYLMTQKVEMGTGKNYVVGDVEAFDFEALTSVDEFPADFPFLMEVDDKAAVGIDFFITSSSGNKLTVKEPEYLQADLGDKYNSQIANKILSYVKTKFDAMYDAIINDSANLGDLVDIDSLTRYYLVNELVKNYDIGVSSCYFVYKQDDAGNWKFFASPVWDFDNAMGNASGNGENLYQSYEGDWATVKGAGGTSNIMTNVANNSTLMELAKTIWFEDFYPNLLDILTDSSTSKTSNYLQSKAYYASALQGSFSNNYQKWTLLNGSGWVVDHSSLTTATYDLATETYKRASSATSYNVNSAEGQVGYAVDWLTSRIAWMSYNFNNTLADYYVIGKASPSGDWVTWTQMSLSKDGKYAYATVIPSTNGEGEGFKVSHSTTWNDYTGMSIDTSKNTGATLTGTLGTSNLCVGISDTITYKEPLYICVEIATGKVYAKATLKDVYTAPTTVTLTGSVAQNELVDAGTSVTLSAIASGSTHNDEEYTGEYTYVFKLNGSVINTVTTAETAQITVQAQIGDNKYTVEAYPAEQPTASKTSEQFIFRGDGVLKLYFDPNSYPEFVASADSVVTATLGNGSTFRMTLDPEDKNGTTRKIFMGYLDESQLDYLRASTANTITFTLGTASVTCAGDPAIQSGYILTCSFGANSTRVQGWSSYNTKTTVTSKPENFDELLLKETVGDSQIVYFDNSATEWYEVYMFTWNLGGSGNLEGVKMTKLEGFDDMWYYDFGDDSLQTYATNPDAGFLFKDRSGSLFGSGYNQSVDLIDTTTQIVYDYSAISSESAGVAGYEAAPVNFKTSYKNTSNPVFVASGFYVLNDRDHVTASNMNFKYRAYAYEFKDLKETYIDNQILYAPVRVYFDLHDRAIPSLSSISLYHTSNSDASVLPPRTELARLGNSTIYAATISLPYYSVENGSVLSDTVAFTFDKLLIGSEEYPISSNAQPAYRCITSGEVWYESYIDNASNVNESLSNDANDVFGVLAYKHSTTVFTATDGGVITQSSVKGILYNGYNSEAQDVGYVREDGDNFILRYALPDKDLLNGNTYVDYSASTATSISSYKFAGWTIDDHTVSLALNYSAKTIATDTVTVIANWTEKALTTYTFNYTYFEYNTKIPEDIEFNPSQVGIETTITVQVALREDSTEEDILARFNLNIPFVESKYYLYNWKQNEINISGTTYSVLAQRTPREYSVTINADGGLSEIIATDYKYQNAVSLNASDFGIDAKNVEWYKVQNGNEIIVCNSQRYNFRVTTDENIFVRATDEDKGSYVVVNLPTFEIKYSNNVKRIYMNFLVENFIEDDYKSKGYTLKETGVLYYWADEAGNPVDKTTVISDTTLLGAANTTSSPGTTISVNGISKRNSTAIINQLNKFIYIPSVSDTPANRAKNFKVHSYMILTNGTDTVTFISESGVVADLSKAPTE